MSQRLAGVVVVLAAFLLGFAAARGQDPEPAGVEAGDGEASDLERARKLDEEVVQLFGEDRYAEAAVRLRASVAIKEKALGKDAPAVTESLEDLGLLLSYLGSYDESRALYERVLAAEEKRLGPEHPDLARILNGLAEVLANQSAFAEARSACERALRLREAEHGPKHPQVAISLHALAHVIQSQGAFAEARPLFERALQIDEEAFGPDHVEVGVDLNSLAGLLVDQGELLAARPLYERALAIHEKALGPDDPEVGSDLNNLGNLLWQLGAFAEAESALRRALAIVEAAYGPAHPFVATCLNNVGALLHETGDLVEALALYERALAIDEQTLPPDHPDIATSLNNLASLRQDLGALEDARPLYERALRIDEKALGPEHPDLAKDLNNLGTLFLQLGAIEQARPLYERALAIHVKAHGPEHPAVARSLNNVALALERLGSRDEARALYERALAIGDKVFGRDHPDAAATLTNLGSLLKRQGEYEGARQLYERALRAKEGTFGGGHPALVQILNNLALLSEAEGELDQARQLFERTVAILERAYGPDHPDLAAKLTNLAGCLKRQGRYDEATSKFERALRIRESAARRFLAGTAPAERLAMATSVRRTLDNWLVFTKGTSRTAYDEVLRFKGIASRASAVDQRVHRSSSDAERAGLRTLAAAQRRLAGFAHSVPTEDGARALWRERFTTQASLCQQLSLELAERSRSFGESRRRLDLGMTEIRAAMRPREVLIDYLRYAGRYAAWVVRSQGGVVRVELDSAPVIEAAAERFRSALLIADRSEDPALTGASARLRELIWEPLERHLRSDDTTIYVVPDAALGAVPFAALPGSKPGSVLLEQVTLVYLAFAQDLVPWETPSLPGAGLLAFGGVAYDAADDALQPGRSAPPEVVVASALPVRSRASGSRTFEALAGTGLEIDGLVARFDRGVGEEGVRGVKGPLATEASLRSMAPGSRIVHLATHGFVRRDLLPGAGGIGTSGAGDLDMDHGRFLPHYDRLVLAGLALAGANRREGGGADDGILTALEATSLNLDGVQLVTLSACDTASGDAIGGEGILGLARGFQTAGAKAVVASLWQVDDDATRRLMDLFYERALSVDASRPPALALREAALALRTVEVEAINPTASMLAGRRVRTRQLRFRAPRDWAAWVAYGPLR